MLAEVSVIPVLVKDIYLYCLVLPRESKVDEEDCYQMMMTCVRLTGPKPERELYIRLYIQPKNLEEITYMKLKVLICVLDNGVIFCYQILNI